MNKQKSRLRRGLKAKSVIFKSKRPRLVVFRSANHIYSQIVFPGAKGDLVLVSASTLDKGIKTNLSGTKCEQAKQVGRLLAERAKEKEVQQVAFDRAGYRYHGRVKALAEGAREAGLDF